MAIRIVIVDDIPEIRDYFAMVLEKEQDMSIAGTAASGVEAYEVVAKLLPDIVLMDIQMETEYAGIEAIRRIKADFPETKIIVLTISEDDEVLLKAFGAGAVDYIVKKSSIVEKLNSIRNAYSNTLQMRPEVSRKILTELTRLQNAQSSLIYTLNIMSKLTPSEYEILKDIYHGKKYRIIAEERQVEEVTIRTQVNRILKKFGRKKMSEVIQVLAHLRIFDIYV
ncbi:MAG: two component transcriptional regulator, LuxR family [Paenibacillaceae bacterium]|jgi:DNA-binding NarL/FixJ family response regulator|nr:two component transcriptional regulator, LuxR family [Paenibacillaceae bacterium]